MDICDLHVDQHGARPILCPHQASSFSEVWDLLPICHLALHARIDCIDGMIGIPEHMVRGMTVSQAPVSAVSST